MSDAEGKMDETKGRVKQAIGDLRDDDDLRREGKADEVTGSAKQAVAEAEEKMKDGIDRVKDKLHRD